MAIALQGTGEGFPFRGEARFLEGFFNLCSALFEPAEWECRRKGRKVGKSLAKLTVDVCLLKFAEDVFCDL